MNIQQALGRLVQRQDLGRDEMRQVMQAIMAGDCTDAQIGAFLVALRMKGETVEELTAAVEVMRALAKGVTIEDKTHLVDTCGTGGDGANTFNISTASAFVAAAAGAKVAKHGNRSISSRSGSADVLEAAGVNLSLSVEQVSEAVQTLGVGFMFAPAHHSAMKHAIGPRKEIGLRSIFNLLGPMSNPAGAPNQVIGVFDQAWLIPMAETLRNLGSEHVLLVHAQDGLDEISIASATHVVELKHHEIHRYTLQPEDFGLARSHLAELAVEGPQDSLRMIEAVLDNQPGPARDIVCLNAGASIYVSGCAVSLEAGVERARDVIAQGLAKEKLTALINFGK